MPSLNLDLDYPNHPKVKRLVGLLGRGADILPIRLWLYVGKYHAADGQLIGYSPQEIEMQIEWWGKQGACMDALIKVALLDVIDGGYQVHDWETHAGHIHALKIHALNMNKKRWAKYRGDPDSIPDSIPIRTPIGTPNKVVGNAGSRERSVPEGSAEGRESTPAGAHRHPLLLALKAAKAENGSPRFPRLRWVSLKQGIEPPSEVADTVAAVDALIAVYGLPSVVSAFCAAAIGKVSVAEARGEVSRYLAKQSPEKAAQATRQVAKPAIQRTDDELANLLDSE
jgi:hypothetical protein